MSYSISPTRSWMTISSSGLVTLNRAATSTCDVTTFTVRAYLTSFTSVARSYIINITCLDPPQTRNLCSYCSLSTAFTSRLGTLTKD
jgi:hypothetical protein